MLRRIRRLGRIEGWRTVGRLAGRTGRDAARSLRGSAAAGLVATGLTAVRRARLRRELVQLWGPGPEPGGPGEATAVCLMRNGEPYVRSFVEHHTAMGVRQIVLLDNGSADRTLELLRPYDHVTVLRSLLPFREYQMVFREHLLRHWGAGGWRLLLDIDELFDYPHSPELPLGGLLGYLNARGYSAVVAYLLDMFADGPLGALGSAPEDDLRATYPYYDISNIRTRGYAEHYGETNAPGSPAIGLYWGGIRNTLFGSRDWLTKHPLQFPERGARPAGHVAHDVWGARVADISAVLYHYKFLDRLLEQSRAAVREGNYYRGSAQYRRYLKVLEETPDLQIRRATARRLEHVDQLVDEGFLAVSPAYAAWVGNVVARAVPMPEAV
ncbi:MAG TPA: glycosyltransferase family 2 protein [Chloroflexaceae bacterium]|nr:glycosyltransferase family 2 protein [Chloroflexaceae bacterium]